VIKGRDLTVFINLVLISFLLIVLNLSCAKSTRESRQNNATLETIQELDVEKIENVCGVQFKILKSKVVGYKTVNKFYWVCLNKKSDIQKVEQLSREMINEVIAGYPRTYHSVTIHIFIETDLKKKVEKSEPCARASFLPEGGWSQVGRIPINNYEKYKLTCDFF